MNANNVQIVCLISKMSSKEEHYTDFPTEAKSKIELDWLREYQSVKTRTVIGTESITMQKITLNTLLNAPSPRCDVISHSSRGSCCLRINWRALDFFLSSPDPPINQIFLSLPSSDIVVSQFHCPSQVVNSYAIVIILYSAKYTNSDIVRHTSTYDYNHTTKANTNHNYHS